MTLTDAIEKQPLFLNFVFLMKSSEKPVFEHFIAEKMRINFLFWLL